MPDELFELPDKQFSLTVGGTVLNCERMNLPGFVAFHIVFNSSREPLVVARAKGQDRPFFWTSIPEGRQKEAEGVGKLIEEYLKEKK